jgi:UDP-2,3-diacylglucosamine pyrophosphatase LpxH
MGVPFEQIGQSARKRLWRQNRDTSPSVLAGPATIPPVPTAIVSDLHLGSLGGYDVARQGEPQERLLAALEGADRVVLLGDALELREHPLAEGVELARPLLERIGRVTAGKRVVLVPGNHDYQLAEPFLTRLQLEGAPLGPEQQWPVAPDDGPAGRVARLMPDTDLTLAYPGLHVREDVYATHGHYLDVHLTMPRLEAVAAGVMGRISKRSRDCRSVEDYEAVMSPLYAALARLAEGSPADRLQRGGSMSRSLWAKLNPPDGGGGLSRLLLARVAFPSAVAALNLVGLGPLKADVSAEELRRSGLRAMGRVAEGMGVSARHVVFGHTHRSGPWPGDDASEWHNAAGTRLWNTGSWLYEGAFLRGERPQGNPYWPGVVTRVDDSGDPQLDNVLRELSPAACLP